MTTADSSLRISDSLELPVEAVVETFAILGKRGSGKTSTAVVMAEEMIGAGHPAVVIDPVGVWWGLRSSLDGKGSGLPVVIFGGDHADVPLMEKAGEVIADAIIEGRFPAILDLSHLSKGAMRRFLADFLERLYHRNREPLHLFVDEADLLAPQRLPAEGLRLFGAMDDIQRRGRTRGLGTTLITQRPAVINKDLLSQAEVLIALRLTGARDVAAIDEWVRLNADEGEASTVKASLASLPVGTAWIWSPSLLGVLSKVQVRRRNTFDSSATPKPGQPRPVAEAFAAIDTAALGAQIEALAQEAAATDPAALKARIARLEKELEQARAAAPAPAIEEVLVEVPVEVEVKVPVLDVDDIARLEAAANSVLNKLAALDGARKISPATHRPDESSRQQPAEPPPTGTRPRRPATRTRPRTLPETSDGAGADRAPEVEPAEPRGGHSPRRPASRRGESAVLPKAQQLILTALAQHGTRSSKQLALLTSYSHKSGGFRNALSALRSAGYISGPGTGVTITPVGLQALGSYDPLPVGVDLLEWWKTHHLGKAERAIVDILLEDYPGPVPVDEIAARAGYSATSGGYRNALSRLRTLTIAHNASPGHLVLDEELAQPCYH